MAPKDLPASPNSAGFPLRSLFLGLSFIATVVCAGAAAAHYRKSAWGNAWQPIGWLLGMLFLFLAFSPQPREIGVRLKSLVKPRTGFFLFWMLFFVVSHLWNFRTAPWNGNGLFDDSAVDLLFLKSYVMGHPFQPAWFHAYPLLISRETLFHYYVWGFLHLFGYNILSYEASLFLLWCTVFAFTLLLLDLLFRSYLITSIAALIFNFLVFSFLYTFVGYRYPMTVALCLASLYFLYRGIRSASFFHFSLGGLAAGLCLASSILGKQYLMALGGATLLYAGFNWKTFRRRIKWSSIGVAAYGYVAAAMPILCYIGFNRQDYTYYEAMFLHNFWQAAQGNTSPHDIGYYVTQLWYFFFIIPGPRLFFSEVLPIPWPYYCFLLPGFILALRRKRYEIALLATIPVIGVFVSAGGTVEHRMLLAIPFWIILMGFSFAALSNLKLHSALRMGLLGISTLAAMWGLVPSVQRIYGKTKDPSAISYYSQGQVAVARFLRYVVAGKKPPNPPRLKRNEFNRIPGIPDASYETLICPGEAYSIAHLFLHDYDDGKILSLCGGSPMYVMTLQAVWSANKKAIVEYVPTDKDLKLIWESGATTEKIIQRLRSLSDLSTEESLGFSFAGTERKFYVLNVVNKNIRLFQARVRALPDSPP